MNIDYSIDQLDKVVQRIVNEVSDKILLFYGAMGVGKTTLIKEIVKQLGSDDAVSSPTFSLVNEYHIEDKKKIFHFDFYRINDEEEAMDMGAEEYFYSGNWCLIEWPEKIKNLLPLDAVEIHLRINDDGSRNIQIK